jgi:two-component system invasion response regulator UvrY
MQEFFDPVLETGGKVRLVVIGTSMLIREALRTRFEKCTDLEVVGEVTLLSEAVVWIQRTCPDIILLQASLAKDGIEATKKIVTHGPQSKVMLMTEVIPWHLALRLFRAGAQGLIFTSASSEEVVKAVRRMVGGKIYLPSELEGIFAERHLMGYDGLPEELLTEREFQIMTRLAQGQTNREIARELFISVKTVDTHRASLLRKLGLRNNSDLTRFALQMGFL